MMDRDGVVRLLSRRRRLTGQGFDGEAVDVWLDLVSQVDEGDATVAMNRACAASRDVRYRDFAEEVTLYRQGRRYDQVGEVCPMCDDSGWREAPPSEWRGIRTTQSEPCACRQGRR